MMMYLEEITIIILAGGKSSRMGVDKGLMLLNGKPMVQYVLDAAKQLTPHILLVANNPEYQQFGYPVFADIWPETGPMGGIFTGLTHSQTDKNLVLACDTPYLQASVLRILLGHCEKLSITVATLNGQLEPLFAVYDKKCLPLIAKCLQNKVFKLQNLIDSCGDMVKKVEMSELVPSETFRNLNTPEDLSENQIST
jgi:molybdopterin-guanine dinucleotide biosynthesis protein A